MQANKIMVTSKQIKMRIGMARNRVELSNILDNIESDISLDRCDYDLRESEDIRQTLKNVLAGFESGQVSHYCN